MPFPSVYILILNWNGWRNTIECLESIQQLYYPNYRIIVIDNGSTDGSLSKIKDWAAGKLSIESKFVIYNTITKPVTLIEYDLSVAKAGGKQVLENKIEYLPYSRRMILIKTNSNLGYAGGNNIGIKYALRQGAEYIWLLNNDTVVDKYALIELLKLAESNKRIGMVGSKLLYYNKPDIIQAAGGGWFNFWQGLPYAYGWLEKDRGQWDNILQVYGINGASLLVRNKVIEMVGYLSEAFFLYGEETEWQIRATKQGWLLFYCPGSKVWHKENASLGYKSPLVEYYSTRNNIWITRRYSKRTLPVAMFFHFLRVIRRIAKGDFRRAVAVSKGIWEGLRYFAW